MRIAISGSSGLVGSALVRVLRSEGDGQAHQVLRLVRRDAAADDEVTWDPATGPDSRALAGVDAFVHLAGVGFGDHRMTTAYKDQIRGSRIGPTLLLAEAAAALDPKPRVFISASAVGYYGDTGDRAVDENDGPGDDFPAQTCVQWERATAPAADAGIRTVQLRSGIVLSTKGGALGKVLPLFKAGLGARLGSGKQYLSWIARPDHIAAIRFLLDADQIHGAVDVTAPEPVTNRRYTKAIAAAVHRPAMFLAPAPALRLVLGEFAAAVVGGQRVLPTRLLEAGFGFGYPEIEPALRALVAANA
jgi:uncharacterized protein (TIGR01777 family)